MSHPDDDMASEDLDDLVVAIRAAAGSEALLATAFNDAVARLGRDRASQLWWRAFSAADASET